MSVEASHPGELEGLGVALFPGVISFLRTERSVTLLLWGRGKLGPLLTWLLLLADLQKASFVAADFSVAVSCQRLSCVFKPK